MLPLEKTYALVAKSKQILNGLAKKSILVAPHDYGKLEITGFLPSAENPEKIVLKWHEIAMPHLLPDAFKESKHEDLLVLEFKPDSLFCLDDILKYNKLPFVGEL